MEDIILSLAVALTVSIITAIPNPKIRGIIYVLPIPISIILIGTNGRVNATHIFGLVLVLLFMIVVWFLYVRLHLSIIIAIVLGVIFYVVAGITNQVIVHLNFWIAYGLAVLGWGLNAIYQPIKPSKLSYFPVKVRLGIKGHSFRATIISVLTYCLIRIKDLILGAAVTFPFNGIFTVYIMRDQLQVLIAELLRNFIALFNFFAVVYVLQTHVILWQAVFVGWTACIVSLFVVTRCIPRNYKERSA